MPSSWIRTLVQILTALLLLGPCQCPASAPGKAAEDTQAAGRPRRCSRLLALAGTTLAIEAIWEVDQQVEGSLSLSKLMSPIEACFFMQTTSQKASREETWVASGSP